MSDQLAAIILYVAVGYSWGKWIAERRAEKKGKDAALRMLTDMLQGILDKRKIVGRGMTIWREHRLDCMGERLTLTLKADGDPSELASIDLGERNV